MPAKPAFEKIPPLAGAAPMPAPPPDEDGTNGGVPPTVAPGKRTVPPAPKIGGRMGPSPPPLPAPPPAPAPPDGSNGGVPPRAPPPNTGTAPIPRVPARPGPAAASGTTRRQDRRRSARRPAREHGDRTDPEDAAQPAEQPAATTLAAADTALLHLRFRAGDEQVHQHRRHARGHDVLDGGEQRGLQRVPDGRPHRLRFGHKGIEDAASLLLERLEDALVLVRDEFARGRRALDLRHVDLCGGGLLERALLVLAQFLNLTGDLA